MCISFLKYKNISAINFINDYFSEDLKQNNLIYPLFMAAKESVNSIT